MRGTRQFLPVAAVLAVVATLASCASPEPEPTAVDSPAPVASTPAALVPPVSAFAVECDDLVDPGLMTEVWGNVLPLGEGAQISLSPSGLIDAAVVHDGALSCTWASAIEGEPALTIVALPDAAAAWSVAADTLVAEPYSYTRAPIADGAVVGCDDAYSVWGLECVWNATRDDVWIFVGARFLPDTEATLPSPRDNPDTSREPPVPTVEGSLVGEIVENALATLASADRVAVPRPLQAAPDCTELFSAPSGVTLLGGREARGGRIEFSSESVPRTNQSLGGAMGYASAERLGYVECVVPDSGSHIAVSLAVAPEAAWLVDQPTVSVAPSAEHVGDVAVSCAEYSCLAFGEVDGFLVAAETSTGERSEDEAREAAVRAVQSFLDALE